MAAFVRSLVERVQRLALVVALVGLLASSATADTLAGRVLAGTTPVAAAIVELMVGGELVAEATTDASGGFTIQVSPGTYFVRVRPHAGSGLSELTRYVTVAGEISVDFLLSAGPAAELTVRVRDGLGEAVPSQSVSVMPASGGASTMVTTGPDGTATVTVSPGVYSVMVHGGGRVWVPDPVNLLGVARDYALPQSYMLNLSAVTVDEAVVLDIQAPVVPVTVAVQDPQGQPVAGVGVAATNGFFAGLIATSLGALSGSMSSSYWAMGSTAVTDATGTTTLWLAPTPADGLNAYSLTATPPPGPFAAVSQGGIRVSGARLVVVALSFAHEPPQTTATIEEAPGPDGAYPDPARVRLDAAATASWTIADVRYRVDGGPVMSYAAPFAVSGAGPHTVEYWAIDSAGVYEAPKTLSFVIVSDRVTPVTTAVLSGTPSPSGWYDTPVTVFLTAYDDDAGSGVRWITYSANDGRSAAVSGSSATVEFAQEGTWTLSYRAEDHAGNLEAPQSLTIKIDRTAPEVAVETPAGVIPADRPLVVRWTSRDGLAGIATEAARVSGITVQNGGALDVLLWPRGEYEAQVTATDFAGNIGVATSHFTIVPTVTGLPLVLGRFCAAREISHEGVCASLQAKAARAVAAATAGRPAVAVHQLSAMLNELEAQRGKKVSLAAFAFLHDEVRAIAAALR